MLTTEPPEAAPPDLQAACRALLDAMDEGGAILIGTRIVYCNSRFAALLGAQRAQLAGHELLDLLPAPARAAATPLPSGPGRRRTVSFDNAGGARLRLALSPLQVGARAALCATLRVRRPAAHLGQLRLAASVYRSSSEAMLVTDADNRILSVNPAFTRITGYAPEQALGRNPAFLGSGRQDAAFYRAMWDALRGAGHWAGEIWNRRRDGELYVEWLSIDVVRDRAGAPRRHVALFSDITEKKKSERLIWTQANFDALTGLPNRRLFSDRLEQGIERALRAENGLALLLIDLDAFKQVNDQYGHLAGDALLVEAGRRIGACVRGSDTVARLGGDEFAVILADIGAPGHAAGVAQALLDALAQAYPVGAASAHVTASIGIALCPGDARDPLALLNSADQAMYQSKEDGRNRFRHFSRAIEEQSLARARLVRDLRLALPAGQFELFFQPVHDLRSGALVQAEALLRWRHPRRGLLEPADFLAALEETGLIVEVGDWVFRSALGRGRRWSALLGRPLPVCVNVSPVQLLAAARTAQWPRQMREAGVGRGALLLDITAPALLAERPESRLALERLRDAGIALALDDFGSGRAALSCLNRPALDYLKLDRALTRDLAGAGALAWAKALIAMGHELGLRVIAEGIESQAQRDLLTGAGCDYGQGHWFGAAVPAPAFEQLLCRRDD